MRKKTSEDVEVIEEVVEPEAVEAPKENAELEELRELLDKCKAHGFHSIGDIEVRIARLQ